MELKIHIVIKKIIKIQNVFKKFSIVIFKYLCKKNILQKNICFLYIYM